MCGYTIRHATEIDGHVPDTDDENEVLMCQALAPFCPGDYSACLLPLVPRNTSKHALVVAL